MSPHLALLNQPENLNNEGLSPEAILVRDGDVAIAESAEEATYAVRMSPEVEKAMEEGWSRRSGPVKRGEFASRLYASR